jgi:hypothetical protein
MLDSLSAAVDAAGGRGDAFTDWAARMTVLELCEMLGNNDVRFVYAPCHIKHLVPDSLCVVVGEFTLLAEGGRVKGVSVNGHELSGVTSVDISAPAGGVPTVRLELVPAQSYPQIPG